MKKLLTTLAILSTIFVANAQQNLSQGGTGWNTSTLGDLFVGTTSAIRYTRLPIGSTGNVLWVLNGQPAWVSTSSLGITGSGGITNAYATATFPSFPYASSTYVTYPYATSTFLSFLYGTSTFVNFGYGTATFPTFLYGTSTFPSFTYGSSSYLASSYQTYASNTFITYPYGSSTFPSLTYGTNTYVTYPYATNTFTSFTYATNTYANYTYATNTFAGLFTNNTLAGTNSFTGKLNFGSASGTVLTVGTLFSTSTTYLPTLPNSILGTDVNGKIIATTTAGATYTGSYPIIITGTVISSGFSTGTPNTWFATNTFTLPTFFSTASGSVLTVGSLISTSTTYFPSVSNTVLATDFNGKLIATTTSGGTTYTGTYPIIVSGSVISSGFATNTPNGWTATNTFTAPTYFSTASGSVLTVGSLFSTSSLYLNKNLFDSVNASGNYGSVLISTGTSTLWLATSSLGLINQAYASSSFVTYPYATSTFPNFTYGSSTWVTFPYATATFPTYSYGSSTYLLSGGAPGKNASWLTPSSLTNGSIFDNGTVSGVNATSSTVNFLIQGTGNNNPFNVIASSSAPFITLLPNGSFGVGTSSFLSSNQAEKFKVDAGSSTETGIATYANINDFHQIVCTNLSNGINAECGFTAQNSASTPTSTYAWLGINGTGFATSTSYSFGGPSDVTLIGAGNNMWITNASTTGLLSFMTGGVSTTTNTQMTISSTGTVRFLKAVGDFNNSTGTLGQLLMSTGSSTQWISTSSLGITGGGGVTGTGIAGKITRWLTSTTIGTGISLDDGTVAGINATTSTSTFLVLGNAGTVSPFTVASSSAKPLFQVSPAGIINIWSDSATTTVASTTNIFINGGIATSTLRNNIGIGFGTLANVGTDRNIAIGYNAMSSSTVMTGNGVAIGFLAMSSNTTGRDNVAVGSSTLSRNSTGNQNTAIGNSAMRLNLSGTGNSAFGDRALDANTTGSNNVAFGPAALRVNPAGSDNVAVGFGSLSSLTTGNSNVAIGSSAGGGQTNFSNSTFIGYFSDFVSTAFSTSTAIGYNARVNCGQCMVLGGTGVNDYEKVGIGTTTPAQTLIVRNNNNSIDPFSVVNNSGSPLFYTNALGMLGIGTSSPTNTLTVASGSLAVLQYDWSTASSTSMTIDWKKANAQFFKIGSSATTINFTNATTTLGQHLMVTVCNPSAGTAGALTWNGVTWPSATAPTQTTAANKCDTWSFFSTQGTSSNIIMGNASLNY